MSNRSSESEKSSDDRGCDLDSSFPANPCELLPMVYQELRRIAASRLARESPDISLQPTVLVHEVWLKLSDSSAQATEPRWRDRRHFLAAASEAMKRILVDAARRRRADKRGGQRIRELTEIDSIVMPGPPDEIERLHDALAELARVDAPAAELVHLRYFVGLTLDEAADIMNLPKRTADRLWAFARSWLKVEMGRS